MLHKQAKKLAYFLTQQNIIETGNENIYAYGLELILSGSIGISLVIISSVILGYPALFIPFLLGYISYRVNAGGFHAKSHCVCIISFLIIYIAALIMLPFFLKFSIFPIMAMLSTLIQTIVYAPFDVKNNPLRPAFRKKRRCTIIILTICNTIAAIIFCVCNIHNSWVTSYYLGAMVAGILLSVAILQDKTERRKQNEA